MRALCNGFSYYIIPVHHKLLFFLLVSLYSVSSRLHAQEPVNSDSVVRQVYRYMVQQPAAKENTAELLQKTAWEALAYMESGEEEPTVEDLREAVPDYYHFREASVVLKLIDPEDYNNYGVEITAPYKLLDNRTIVLMDERGELERDRWRIIAIDENYLALDMGEIRLFFTHTPAQE